MPPTLVLETLSLGTKISKYILLKFPDALRPSFPKLKEKLEDRDTSAGEALSY